MVRWDASPGDGSPMVLVVTPVSDTTNRLLRVAWSALNGDASLVDLVQVKGNDAGLLPSTFAVLPAMVAAVSASTVAASVLDAARRSGKPEPVLIDAGHVAAAARSERYARVEGSPEVNSFAPLSRFWRTADGWLRLHANYAWHKERALRVLGCQDRPEAVEEAIASWSAADLEEALAMAGAVGSAVRSWSQWQAHPQGRAVSALPLLGSAAGRGPGRNAGAGTGAAGLRILDLTRVTAGPVATRTLAAWGADVLRLDSPHLPEIPAQALDTLPGKRSAQLDISEPPGRHGSNNCSPTPTSLCRATGREPCTAMVLRPTRWPSGTHTCLWSPCPRGARPGRGRRDGASTHSSSAPPASHSQKAPTAIPAHCRPRRSTTPPDTWPPQPQCSP